MVFQFAKGWNAMQSRTSEGARLGSAFKAHLKPAHAFHIYGAAFGEVIFHQLAHLHQYNKHITLAGGTAIADFIAEPLQVNLAC